MHFRPFFRWNCHGNGELKTWIAFISNLYTRLLIRIEENCLDSLYWLRHTSILIHKLTSSCDYTQTSISERHTHTHTYKYGYNCKHRAPRCLLACLVTMKPIELHAHLISVCCLIEHGHGREERGRVMLIASRAMSM